ncbi:TetR/AcrR family transcriptional regulator [Pseudovibrio sp. Tun.PSC04-5.I4]|uniref:TetR/AcrR family transcriptional regulator n=1 Tax=Pseudovibrio sp. Tun.PSC04-5.I4 TaxID=1798213 RepID=UPI000881F4A7|nr:TetR/AcrR family transcriptional regulator [Pseudovibrio sp. Tun.PSC04-5.I4]SDQ95577.1 DNA-binding transcriptional regulator, AcrR family [Pseudovibrio sp. Tun.PSC04-5.I4]
MEIEKAPRGRPRRLDKDKMLEIASNLFWQQGFEATSISELVTAMGITPPSLYAAFSSKEELYLAAIDRYSASYGRQMLSGLALHSCAYEAIRTVLYECVDVFIGDDHPSGCMISTGLVESSSAQNALARKLANMRVQTIKIIADKLKACEVQFIEGTDLYGLASFFGATIQGMSIQARDVNSPTDLYKIADHSLSVLQACRRF